MTRKLGLLVALLLGPCRGEAAAPPGQWLVVPAPAFRAAVEPLCEHRRAQGLRVVVVPTGDVLSPAEVRAGVPAFNPLVDRLVESQAMTRFAQLDLSWRVRALYHNVNSRFSVPDDRLRDRALELVQAGQLLTLYLGHSDAQGFAAGRAR